MSEYKSIAITGASRGLGCELALNFAQKGVKFFLNARDESALKALKNELEARDCEVEIAAFDIADENLSKAWCESIFKENLDLLILNASISSGVDESAHKQIEISRINVLGTAAPLFYALEKMSAQALNESGFKGQIAFISSIATLLALTNAPAYSASKHFSRTLGEALALAYPQICFSMICPGFIKTDLTKHIKNLKMMSVSTAAFKITKAIQAKKRFYAFNFSTFLIAKIYNLCPFFIKKIFVNFLKNRAKL